MFVSPEAAATVAALRHLVQDGYIGAEKRIVLLITGNGLKYTHLDLS
jgi:threonine synthase